MKNFPVLSIISRHPNAEAIIKGSKEYPNIHGKVRFYNTKYGIVVYAVINGLPIGNLKCDNKLFGFHIHEGNSCSGNSDDPFANALSHYNPNGCVHPQHAGDMPVLFGNKDGLAVALFLTDRFDICEIIGKTVIVHEHADDFMTQPSGNSGMKIACGIIKSVYPVCRKFN